MVQPARGWAHPSRYFHRFPVKTWDELLTYAGLENHQQYRDRILFLALKQLEDSFGKLPTYSKIKKSLYGKVLYRFGSWEAFLKEYDKFNNEVN